MIAGYAMRLVKEEVKGRALAISMAGIPVALAFGVPLGTASADSIGWRMVFVAMVAASVLTTGWVLLAVPRVSAEPTRDRIALRRVVRSRGLAAVLIAAFAFELGHMSVFTYVTEVVARAGLDRHVGALLLIFKVAATVGLWITGLFIDQHLRSLTLACLALFAVVMAILALAGTSPIVVLVCTAAWGVALGGAPTVFQTASANAAGGGSAVDVAQSMLVTVLNAGMATGSFAGGIVLSTLEVGALPWFGFFAFFAALLIAIGPRRRRFQRRHEHSETTIGALANASTSRTEG